MEKKLNMPQTEFTQRSEATTKEPQLLKLWNELDVFKLRNELNTDEFTCIYGKILNDIKVYFYFSITSTIGFIPLVL